MNPAIVQVSIRREEKDIKTFQWMKILKNTENNSYKREENCNNTSILIIHN